MREKINWTAFKAVSLANPSIPWFWREEIEYHSNDPNVDDICRYWVRITVSSATYDCFITKAKEGEQKSADETEFDLWKQVECAVNT